ncbi:site-specific DNA-methyltransferase [Candidatus Endomicrobiellum agilis]|uniref:site-specific DNA-methyltransferase n=1 Tax=Candidatus Endomicrobiellum agilis TaxID=3238957 RepID=UPI003578C737|nr:site-specific DNA-methyltransferase [Endomicrobium sp.]
MKNFSKESLNITKEKLNEFKQLFPEVFSEGKVDFERLKLILGKNASISDERYVLNWENKREAFTAIQTTTTKTLGFAPEESVKPDSTENVFIEGENLEVLKILQKSYFGKIKMIYIDPPYNTGSDNFIYPDKFSETKEEYLKKIKEKDEEGYLLKEGLFHKNSKENGQFHSNWLNMMYPRLFLAKNLLKDDGVIFISIDDNEVHNLRLLMNEIFGEENFVSEITCQKKTGHWHVEAINTITEHIIVYCKNKSKKNELMSFSKNPHNLEKYLERYKYKDEYISTRGAYYTGELSIHNDSPRRNFAIECPDGTLTYPNGRKEKIQEGWSWAWNEKRVEWARKNNFLEFKKSSNTESGWDVCYKNYLNVNSRGNSVERGYSHKNLIALNANDTYAMKELFGTAIFNHSKSVKLLKTIISFIKFSSSDIVLDFFAGSSTTAQAVMELNKEDNGNRKFICVQLPEKTKENSEAFKAGYKTIAEISKERIRRAAKKIEAEVKKESSATSFPQEEQIKECMDLGFKAYKLKESNFKIWRCDTISDERELENLADLFEDPLKEGAEAENVLLELLLKFGYDLNVKTEIMEVDEAKIYAVNNNELIVCLEKISNTIISKILEIKPSSCFMLDSLFKGQDSFKTNVVLQLQDAEINLKVV